MNFTDNFSEAQKYAADVDFDGTVTDNDYRITADYGVYLDFVSQIR